LKFSLPLIPHTLGGLLIAFTDRIIIKNEIGLEETGIYTVAYQIGSVLGLLTSSFNSAYIPWLYGKLSLNDYSFKVKIVKFTYLYFVLILAGGLLSPFLTPWLVGIVAGEEFQGAGVYVFWIVMGYVFNGMYLMVTGFVFYAKKTGMLSTVTLSIAVLNVPVTYLLVKRYGTIGASISMAIMFGFSFIFTWILSARIYKMPWFTFLSSKPSLDQ
jgi:O-antigen/teichoic acid export membrane protein